MVLHGHIILVQRDSMGWWLELTTVNILAFLLLMVNFKWLTIFYHCFKTRFTCVAVRVVSAFHCRSISQKTHYKLSN